MNRKFIISHKWAAACILLVALTGCSKTSIAPSSDPFDPSSGAPIEFSAQDALTKAVVTDESDIENDPAGILVWDWHTSLAYPNGTHTFDAEQVTYSSELGAWTYSPTRYWLNGTYDFAAVYPSTVTATYAPAQLGEDPILTVEDFDVTNQDDLLVAFNTDIDGSKGKEDNPVMLNFTHALARVKIKLKLNEDDFYVTTEEEDEEGNKVSVTRPIGYGYAVAAGFKKISNVATLSGTNSTNIYWMPSETSDGKLNLSDMVVEYDTSSENSEYIQLGVEDVDILGSDGLFVLPQSFTEDNNDANIYINVALLFPNISNRLITQEIEVPLNTLSTTSWEPNKVYTYIGTITQEFTIEFSIVSVTDWVDDTLGGFIVN